VQTCAALCEYELHVRQRTSPRGSACAARLLLLLLPPPGGRPHADVICACTCQEVVGWSCMGAAEVCKSSGGGSMPVATSVAAGG